ncbi:MAG TPA: Hsp20/alpha crystallin family protein, partial [Thiothrix sp.]|nr:Hsp20/alpha crystallin family protein [Thiothrix sp.]
MHINVQPIHWRKQIMTTNTTQQTVAKKTDAMVIRPHVDIYENQSGATLYADLPGVAKDKLSIDIDQNVLTVKGEVSHQTPDAYKVA